MEFIQAFLFTSKYLLGRNSNQDIFYLFSAFALCFYIWKRHDKLKLVLKIFLPIPVVTLGMAFLYPDVSKVRCIVFLGKMLLNVTLLVFVAYNCKKWKLGRFVETISIIHGIETIIALLFRNCGLWVTENLISGEASVSRLRLFYTDPGSMAFASGLVLVILVYLLLKEEIVWHYVIGIVVALIDLFLSFGVGGITCAVAAIVLMLGMSCFYNVRKGRKNIVKKIAIGTAVSAVFTIVVFVLNGTYFGRFNAIIDGTDYNLNTKLFNPLMNLIGVLEDTQFRGVGFGNGNMPFALDMMNATKAYPNSFIRIIAEGCFFGILLVVIAILGVGYYCFKYGNMMSRALFVYVTLYQMIGGYFTNPTNYFIYGWIIGESLYRKVEITGKCSIKIFMPVNKDKLKIAMIGHKRIPSREGGVEIVVEELSKRMVKLGHTVDAYNRSGQHVSGKEYNVVNYDNLKEYEGIRIIKIQTIEKKGLAAFVYSFLASIYVVGKDYDVIHYHAEGPCLFMWIPSLFGIRTTCTVHGLDWARSGKRGSLGSTIIKFGEKVAVLFADEMIVLSKQVQRYFLERYNRETTLIPNGVNRPERKVSSVITEKYGLDSMNYILALSRLTREKKTDLLIAAYKEIKTEKKLVIAGGSSDSDEYVNSLHELAKDDPRIMFTGFVQGQEMEELYSNAYIYCLPSELEGMPLSLLEAMSYGNCCLVSDIPENADVVRNKGVTFATNNKESLKEELQKLLNQPDMVDKYKYEAADYICKKYSWDDVVNKTLELYRV